MKNLKLLSIIIFSVFIFSCKKDKKHNDSPFTIKGVVVNESNAPIPNAIVKIDGASTVTTASDGTFTISGLDKNQSVFRATVNATGYFIQYKNVDNIDGSALHTTIMLISTNTLATLNATLGGSTGSTGLRVVAGANSFSNADGTPYTGMVMVTARYINKNDPNLIAKIPGGDLMATDSNGRDGVMRSYGFVITEFKDATGNTLVPGNVKVAITLPAGVTMPIASGSAGESRIWTYNSATGKWNEPTQISKIGNEYFFAATREVYQNLDYFNFENGYILGSVTCASGTPIAGLKVTIKSQYTGYITQTNENGKFKVRVEAADRGTAIPYVITPFGSNAVNLNSVAINGTTEVNSIIVTGVLCGNISQCNLGVSGTVTDIDGNVYQTIQIGTQVWMAENLKTTKYKDGSAIPNVTGSLEWFDLTTGAYCYYDNQASNNTTYGKLYNWYAVNTGKLAPAGWHVPDTIEWNSLINYLGNERVAGGKMKSVSSLWQSPNTGATNCSGFSGLPAGWNYTGDFKDMGKEGIFWSSTIECGFYLQYYDAYAMLNAYSAPRYGYSVRCVKDY